MDLCHVEVKKPRPANDKSLLRFHRCHKLGRYAYEWSSPDQNPAVLSAVTVDQLKELEDKGPTLLQSRNSEADHQKMDGVSRRGASADPATSREVASLLMKVAPNTVYVCLGTL